MIFTKKSIIIIVILFTVFICGVAIRVSYLTGYYDGFEKARLALTKGQSCDLY
jgi:hypothetical protein